MNSQDQFGPQPGEDSFSWALGQRLRLQAEGFPALIASDAEACLWAWATGHDPDGAKEAQTILESWLRSLS